MIIILSRFLHHPNLNWKIAESIYIEGINLTIEQLYKSADCDNNFDDFLGLWRLYRILTALMTLITNAFGPKLI